MNAEEMWNEYKKINNNINNEYESWTFGDDSDLLADLVLKGEKTATSSAYELYNEAGKKFNENMKVVCEEFKVVFKI